MSIENFLHWLIEGVLDTGIPVKKKTNTKTQQPFTPIYTLVRRLSTSTVSGIFCQQKAFL